MHPNHKAAKSSQSGKIHRLDLGGTDHPGKVDGSNFKPLKPLSAFKKIERKKGGRVEGDKPEARLDRPCRAKGGRVKHKGTNINVIVAPQGGAGAGAPPMMPPQMAAPHPPMPMPPPGPMPGGAPPGLPPGLAGASPPGLPMRKRGGRVHRKNGGGLIPQHAGGASGLGRLEKSVRAARTHN